MSSTWRTKWSFFQAAVVLILLYGCTTWTLSKRMEKKLDGNYTRMLWAILTKFWKQYPRNQQLYSHLPPISKTIKIRRTRHAGHCWKSRDEFISDVLLWTPSHGRAKAGRPTRTYIQQLCADTGCSLKTCRKQWTIGKGGERGSRIARHDDDEDDVDLRSHGTVYVTSYLSFVADGYIFILNTASGEGRFLGICLLKGLSLLLGARNAPKGEFRRGQKSLKQPRKSFDSCSPPPP